MRKLLNTLYITSPDSYLSRDGENIVVLIENKEKFRIPVHNIESIVAFGYCGASPALMSLCTERNVSLSFLSEGGRFLARISGPVRGNVLLRKRQYQLAEDKKTCLELCRLFIAAKIANSRNILQRALRDHANEKNASELTEAVSILENRQKQVLKAEDPDTVRGIEGEAAATYFSVFNHLIVSQNDEFYMNGRTRRPPRDKVNALLSFMYTLLANEVQSALETVGLDPYVGFLHTLRPGRPGLALDLMEELRSYLAERMVLTLINRRQVKAEGFITRAETGIIMDDSTRKEVITAWQKRKQEEVQHLYLQETIPVGLIPYAQALLFARYIRGDIDNYPVFLFK